MISGHCIMAKRPDRGGPPELDGGIAVDNWESSLGGWKGELEIH